MSEKRASDSSLFEISADNSGTMIRYRLKGFWDADGMPASTKR